VELRRALLLFAIVLGVAAIASSIARPPDDDDQAATDRGGGTRTGPAAVEPVPDAPEPTTIEFEEAARPQTLELEAGRPATVAVEVDTPGEVGIPSLGLTAPAEPLTPAMFELLVGDAGSHAITVRPAGSEARPSRVGTLRVVPGS
jgi:hypothetical protein